MVIRKAKKTDLSAILYLNSLLFKYERKFGNTYNPGWTYSKIGRAYFSRRISDSRSVVLVAETDKEIVGYICLHVDIYSYRSVNPIAEIENMYVKKVYRYKGIGTALAERAMELGGAKGAKRFRVEALQSNKDTAKFYKYLGFKSFSLIFEK
ncbi:MAG: GNAT family N-acetyltransferase [Candidatus Dojkabacteria bacterium]|nr:GNAT family N-acetyltransferase [Candidatus Dojkabacteria bacterium]